jgi:hypothetical protein
VTIVWDLPEHEYHSDRKALSASGAKTLLRCPAKFRWEQEHPKESDNFDVGTAAHALVLGSGIEAVYVAPFDNWLTKAAKEEKALARANGLSPILPETWLVVCDMADALASHKEAMELLSDGHAEVTMYADDAATGVTRRGRLDWLREDGLIADYKTTACADPQVFARASVAQYGYHISEANYRWLAAKNDIDVPAACFIVQEKEPPYLVEVIEIDTAGVGLGYQRMTEACLILARCTTTGHWPGYTDAPFTTVSLPAWAFRDAERTITPDPIWEDAS